MVAQNISVRGSESLDLGGGNRRENECSQESYDGKGAHGAQYGADPRDRQANGDGRKLDGIADALRELWGMGWSLQEAIAKSVGVSTASVARGLG